MKKLCSGLLPRVPISTAASPMKHIQVTCPIEQLPDEILVTILSFLPTLAEMARTSILGPRWRNLWHHVTCLDFDASTMQPMEILMTTSHACWYVAWVNKVISSRVAIPGLPLVKELRIWFGLDARESVNIDRWVRSAIDNQVEKLHLDLRPYLTNIVPDDQYKLSEASWSGLASLTSLKSLSLSNVNVTKQFIEFILSNCPLLEHLSLCECGCFCELDVSSGVSPLRLKQLIISQDEDFVLTKLDAPYLTSLYYKSGMFNPQKIHLPMLTELTIGSAFCSQHIKNYLDHFWRYLPQLEKLELLMQEAERFRLSNMPELAKLKYLKISVVCGDFKSIFYKIVNFIDTCPSLETFALQMFDSRADTCSSWSVQQLRGRQRKPRRKQIRSKDNGFKCLKVLKLYGAQGQTIDQKVAKHIIRNAPWLKKLVVDIHVTIPYPDLWPRSVENVKFVEAKAKELCQARCSDFKITVIC